MLVEQSPATKFDFDYYKRSISLMYQKYYQRRLIASFIVLLVVAAYLIIMRESLVINGLIIIAVGALIVYLFLQLGKFEEIYAAYEKQNKQMQVKQLIEDETSYLVNDQAEKKMRIKKNGMRNFPSNDKQYTMMVGFSKNFFSTDPLKIVYYDMLDIKYEEKYRLSRGGYSSTPRFLRRFTPSNLKRSFSNLGSNIIGNLFLLFIIYRLARYLWRFIRMLLNM